MNTKLRIKMGSVEVEYEGSDEFLKKELPELLKGVLELHARADVAGDGDETGIPKQTAHQAGNVSPSTAAVKLQVNTGSSLALAAAISLVVGGRESFTRAELLKAMQQVKTHYKKTYRGNLTNILNTLVKGGDFLDQGSDKYGLSANKRKELEAALAA